MTNIETTIIDGARLAAELRQRVAASVETLRRAHGVSPGLAVVIVGEDPASQVYVRNKVRFAVDTGILSRTVQLPQSVSEAELIGHIAALNADDSVDGVLVQMPLPRGLDTGAVIEAIDPAKDVDGFHPFNAGRLMSGQHGLVPCTPLGCRVLLRHVRGDLSGLEAVVVGRSNIVGKPTAMLLLRENCTVTLAHSKTRDLAELCRRADIIVAAIGRPHFIQGAWIKPGATVIDVGISHISDGGKTGLVGDVDFASAIGVAGAITPVPGGVGPMTIACLLSNTLQAAVARRQLPADNLVLPA